MNTKQCTKCKQELSIDCYRSRGGSQKHLLKSKCNRCLYEEYNSWIKNNPEKVKDYREKDSWTLSKRCKRRGISPEQLIEKFESQNGKCAICQNEITLVESAIDHNHKTNEFRGVLCKVCNRALGMFKDSPKILLNAHTYLKNNTHYGDS